VILELSPEVRRVMIKLIIALTEQGQAPPLGEEGEVLTSDGQRRQTALMNLRRAVGR